ATVAITTALRGAGGFGKTTLAQALAFDDRVRRTYPGGILWVTMGESVGEGGRVARIRDLLRWWQGEEPPAFETPGAAGAQLREALAGERVLLVLDDVWKYADVAPFRGLAPGSALLVTTRDSRTLPPGSRRVEVDAMEVSEAVKLLASGLEVADATPFAALASRLGEWPLLVKLANRQLVALVEEGGIEVGEALREVGEGLDEAGLTAFDVEDHDARELAVSRTLEVGLRRLSEEDRGRFAQLAVFPEDTDLPLAVVERLWSLGRFATKKLCARLYDLSLLLRFERENATIRLHDVVRQYLLGEQREALPDLHRDLLERCRPAGGRWSELAPEDDYLWRHLAHHLVAAGDGETLRELLLDFRYLRAKLDAANVFTLLADYDALPCDAELRAVDGALRLSAHVLARDGEQLAGQLLGRLLGRGEPGIRRLLQDGAEGSWFRPRFATLTPPGGPLLRILEGHSEEVRAVAVLDQRRVVSASSDRTVRVWDVETGEQLRALERHSGWVDAVAVLDPRREVLASPDGTLRVA
ncbi:MAG: hypothetical protein GY856_06535, partial [bacterium]|nr:hypothetical protein [bacterium]